MKKGLILFVKLFWHPDTQSYRIHYRPGFQWTKLALKNIRLHITFFVLALFFISPAYAVTGAELDALVPKIIMAESSGNPKAIGDYGRSRGLMQVQFLTWRRFSNYPWRDAFDEEKNIQVGRAVLEHINESYGLDATPGKVILSYNTGRFYKEIPKWALNHPNKIYGKILKDDSNWESRHGIKVVNGQRLNEKN